MRAHPPVLATPGAFLFTPHGTAALVLGLKRGALILTTVEVFWIAEKILQASQSSNREKETVTLKAMALALLTPVVWNKVSLEQHGYAATGSVSRC